MTVINGLRSLFREATSLVARWVARNRAVALALLSALASVAMGSALTGKATSDVGLWLRLGLFFLAIVAIVLAGTVPREYEYAERLESLLPVVFRVLNLGNGDRIVVHHLRRWPTRYEQLTAYYPPGSGASKGRTFPMSAGITKDAFVNRRPHGWSIPEGSAFEDAMTRRWSFTEDQLKLLTQDRRSFLAYPIGRNGEYSRFVLYADSSDATKFDEDHGSGTKLIARIREVFSESLEATVRD